MIGSNHARIALALALVPLAGCAGGATGPTAPPSAPLGDSHTTATVRAVLVIPAAGATRSARGRGRQYVAPLPSTKGLIVVVGRKTSSGTTTLSTTGYDLTGTSPGSPCTTSTTGTPKTTCTIAIDAPVTSASAHDVFSLYSYDAVQTMGALPAVYAAAGKLLSQDASDEVPGTSGPNAGNGIVSGVVNTPTFVLLPVVAAPVASIGGATATPLTLSAPGTGGKTDGLSIGGDDADGNLIAAYLAGAGDDAYVNPIGVGATATGGTLTAPSATITSATAAAVQFTYTEPMLLGLPAPPTSPSSTPPSGTITLSAALSGAGYDGESSQATVTQTVGVAPLFAVTDPPAVTATGFSSNVYALQSAVPTGSTAASYTLTPTPATGDDCSAYPTAFTQGTGAAPPQQAVFPIATTATPAGTCTLTLGDGISSVTIVFNPDGTSHSP